MKPEATAGNGQGQVGGAKTSSATYTKVFDGCKQPICGLWAHNRQFYAQLKMIEDAKVRRSRPGHPVCADNSG